MSAIEARLVGFLQSGAASAALYAECAARALSSYNYAAMARRYVLDAEDDLATLESLKEKP